MRGINMKNRIWMATLAALTLLHPLAQAQDQGLGDMMFTAGTVATDGGNEWASVGSNVGSSGSVYSDQRGFYRAAGCPSAGSTPL